MVPVIKITLFLILFLLLKGVKSQSFLNAGAFQIGLGGTILFGDLGGSKGKGTNFVRDFDRQSVRFSIHSAIDWSGNAHFEYRAALSFITLSANDLYSEELSRKTRNLSVKTNIVEMVPSIKYNFYNINKTLGKHMAKNKSMHIYLSTGFGLIYFNPRAKLNGSSYSLKDYATEGQGLFGGAKHYSKFSAVIPFTFGFRKGLNKRASIFIELTGRKSFTDYLDDVSTVYYDNMTLASVNGNSSAALADRNTSGLKQPAGSKRGNPHKNDSYLTVTIGYRIYLAGFGKTLF